MVPGELTKTQNMRHRDHKRWWRRLCSPAGIISLLLGCVFFHLMGHHIVRRVLGRVYTPPALNREKVVVYTRFVRLVEAHPEYNRVHLDMWGGLWEKMHESVTEQAGFSMDEDYELTRISQGFRQVGCVRAEKYSSYVVFMHMPNYILPTSPGVLYSLDGRNPNEVDDDFLNSKKPFFPIKDRWYTSLWLAVNPLPTMGGEKWRLPKSFLIDRSLRDPGSGSMGTTILLCQAAKAGNVKLVQSLISSGAEVNAKNEDGSTPLHSAAEWGQKFVVELLILHEADANAKTENGETPLHYSALQGRADIAELLLANGADINAIDNAKRTPLHQALRWGKHDVAELLMSRGADVNAKDSTGGTPLHYAVSRDYNNIVKLLIAKGANVDAKKANGETPLHYSARQGHVNLTEILLANGADINVKDDEDSTPLHMATGHGHIDVVKLLLAKGTNANARTKQGRTALDLARAAGQADIVKLLKTAE